MNNLFLSVFNMNKKLMEHAGPNCNLFLKFIFEKCITWTVTFHTCIYVHVYAWCKINEKGEIKCATCNTKHEIIKQPCLTIYLNKCHRAPNKITRK